MAASIQKEVRRRRRGPQLEAALLDAAWEELVHVGYASLTMESVAARAHTGIAVLYRRWPNKDQLVLAAIEHYRLDVEQRTFPSDAESYHLPVATQKAVETDYDAADGMVNPDAWEGLGQEPTRH